MYDLRLAYPSPDYKDNVAEIDLLSATSSVNSKAYRTLRVAYEMRNWLEAQLTKNGEDLSRLTTVEMAMLFDASIDEVVIACRICKEHTVVMSINGRTIKTTATETHQQITDFPKWSGQEKRRLDWCPYTAVGQVPPAKKARLRLRVAWRRWAYVARRTIAERYAQWQTHRKQNTP
jgi:hypothetical protein